MSWMGSEQQTATAILLIIAAVLVFLVLFVLTVFFCRRRYCRRSDWQTDGGALHPTNNNNNGASCLNDAYDFQDETDPRRLEQRRVARERQLESAEVQGQISLKTIDRSAASALAVEQLLRDSYVFDTKLMPRPPGDIRVIAAKRDYL